MAVKRWVWKEAAEVIGVVGVITGIVFLAYEIRQNTIAINGSTVQAMADQSARTSFMGLENPSLQLAWQRAGRGTEYMTPEDFSVLAWWYTGVMRVVENRYRQAGFGTINAEMVGGFGGNSNTYRHPAFGVI